MWNTPTPERLGKIPSLYETENISVIDKLIHLHFFLGGCDWYAVEFDGQDIFFGFVILNGDYRNAEWGYFSFLELKSMRLSGYYEIDCELEGYWEVRPAHQVNKICQAQGWTLESKSLNRFNGNSVKSI